IAQLRGRIDEALADIEEGMRVEPPSAFTGIAMGFKLLNRAYAGERDELAALLDEVWTILPEEIPSTIGGLILILGAAQVVAILGLEEHAGKLYDRILKVTETWPHTWFDASLTQRVAGMVAATLHRWDEAENHYR